MLTIWGRRTSSNVQAVMWCVGELGLAYERFDIGHNFGGTDTAEFGRLNPNRLVPVLADDDGPPIWESGAILRYLAAKYGPKKFWPADPSARAQVDKWAEWAKINVAMGFTEPVFWRVVRTAEKDRDPNAIRAAVERLEKTLKIAETQLSRHRFLAGDDFTLADIQFGHVLYRYYDIDIERGDLPAVAGYYAMLRDRPPYWKHVKVDYGDLRVE